MTNPVAPNIDFNKVKFDFSQWHPLDHHPLTRECREHFGGFRQHMHLLWDFKWDIPSKRKKITHCFWGKHRSNSWFKGDGTGKMVYAGKVCSWCMKDLPS